jgi:mannose-6-phosphate isomerase-like protein (cupin superfamily)
MADYTVKRIDDMEAIVAGAFKRARAELGVSAFGMNVIDMPPGITDAYPEHDHAEDGMEEVYVALKGSAELDIEGEKIRLEPDTMVRVASGTMRTVRTGDEPVRMLIVGGVPGQSYSPPEISQLGAPDTFSNN